MMPFPLKIVPSHGASEPPSNTNRWFLRFTLLIIPNGISIVYAQLTADSLYTVQWTHFPK